MNVVESSRLAGSTVMAEPFYRRIVADLRARIASGELPAGSKLPSARLLVEHYRKLYGSPTLTPSTLRHALNLMIELGELRGQQGLGVFVVAREKPEVDSQS